MNLQRYDYSLLLKKNAMGYNFNPVDIAIMVILIPALIGGIRKGFIRQVAALGALILGIWAGWHFSSLLSGWIKPLFGSESNLIDILSFALIFVGVLILVNLIGRAVAGIVKLALLGWLDRILGVLFAIVKYAFVLSIFIHILNSLDKLYHFLPAEKLAESRLYDFVSSIAPAVFPYLQNLQESTGGLEHIFNKVTQI